MVSDHWVRHHQNLGPRPDAQRLQAFNDLLQQALADRNVVGAVELHRHGCHRAAAVHRHHRSIASECMACLAHNAQAVNRWHAPLPLAPLAFCGAGDGADQHHCAGASSDGFVDELHPLGAGFSEPLQFIGLANIQRLLADPMFLRVLGTTALYLVGVVPPIVLGALALAVLVNRALPGMHWFRGAFYTPVLVSIVVAAIAFRWLYAENGLINGWGEALFGEAFNPIGFLTDPLLALPSVMVVTLWKGLGYYMVIFLAGLQGIPKDLYEAAELDGSVGWRQHLDITLPLLRPYVALVAVISAIAATKVFEEVFLMTQGGPADSTRTVVYYVYDLAFQELEISYACTAGLALFLVVLVLGLIQQGLKSGSATTLSD